MKRLLLLLILPSIFLNLRSQDHTQDKYLKDMARVAEEISTLNDTAELVKYVKRFEKVAKKHPEQWLPYYYAAEGLTTVSFYEGRGPKKDAHLARAQKNLDMAQSLREEESEIYVMQALILASRIMVDPKIRAVKNYSQCTRALKKAEEYNSDNPRVYLVDGLTKSVLPEYLGGGPVKAKERFLIAEEKFASFENDTPYWPGWGERILEQKLEQLSDVQVE